MPQSSLSHHSVITQSSLSHRSVITQSSLSHHPVIAKPATSQSPVSFCRALCDYRQVISLLRASHQPAINQLPARRQSITQSPARPRPPPLSHQPVISAPSASSQPFVSHPVFPARLRSVNSQPSVPPPPPTARGVTRGAVSPSIVFTIPTPPQGRRQTAMSRFPSEKSPRKLKPHYAPH